MRVLFVYNGLQGALRRTRSGLPDGVAELPTTHMSEVNFLLIAHWLQVDYGHEVTFLTGMSGPTETCFFPSITIQQFDPANYDRIFLFKTHGLKTAQEAGLLTRPELPPVMAWLDSPGPAGIIGKQELRRLSAIAWGTYGILLQEQPGCPVETQFVCEHGTVFPAAPQLAPAVPRGLYIGRLPKPYLEQLRLAAAAAPILAHALWIETPNATGGRILLRPGQYAAPDVARAQSLAPAGVALRPAVNVVAQAGELSRAAFGLCPATQTGMQILSASKFFDYLALGLPVVMSDRVPEAEHVRGFPFLGELYRQDGTGAELQRAVRRAIAAAAEPGFKERRGAIQRWVFSRATYRHRTEMLNALLR